jgi:hypothetical protein
MNLACSARAAMTCRCPFVGHRLVHCHVERVSDLVRHQNRRDVFPIAQLDDFVVDRRHNDGIQPRRQVVEQPEVRFAGHRAGDRDATPLAAGELRGHPVSRMLMLPFGTLKLISRSTTCSSNPNDTLSNTTADETPFSPDIGAPIRAIASFVWLS